MSDKHPKDGQEAEIKYKITNLKGEILDQTIDRQSFKFIVGDTENIMKCVSDAVKSMVYDEEKTIEINTEEDPNILDILDEDKKNLEENKKLKMEIKLIRFNTITRDIFELSDEEKFEHAKDLKVQFVVAYSQKDYKKGLEIIKEGVNVMRAMNKENITEDMNKFFISLLLNECNCMNNLKDYSNTIKVGQEIIKMDSKSMKAYYYMGIAYAYLDEYSDAQDCYGQLYALIPNKDDPGVLALKDLIAKRSKIKEENAKRRFRAFLAQKDK